MFDEVKGRFGEESSWYRTLYAGEASKPFPVRVILTSEPKVAVGKNR